MELDDQLHEVVRRFPSSRILPTVHLVRVSGAQDRDAVIRSLLACIDEGSSVVEMLITPIMEGRYEGYLPDHLWPSVNGITG